MVAHVRANLWLLTLTLLICAVIYPLTLLGVGQVMFPNKAEGSLILGPDGKPLGSRLIAQPFTAAEYFQPRPSAAGYNGAASAASNWGGSNYLLRDRVARQLGPLVRYRGGTRKGQPVGPDVEAWFQKDCYQGQPGIVAQWAQAHPTLAANWVKDRLPEESADAAVPFLVRWSAAHPGTFPGAAGTDVQSIFFDMWRQDHADADLEPVPADMVMASGSGLDPHITLHNARYQLDRVTAAWAEKTGRSTAQLRPEIEELLRARTEAPLGGLVGVDLVNVLEVNLALRDRYQSARRAQNGGGLAQ